MKILIAILLLSVEVFAASTRTIDADAISSSDKSKNWPLPAVSTTIVGRSSTDTLTSKTLSGASNTFSQLPIASDHQQEVPSGTINGSNVTFTLAFTPVASASVQLYLDGILLISGAGNDYTISGATITMITAPALGQSIRANYPRY